MYLRITMIIVTLATSEEFKVKEDLKKAQIIILL